jgi:hypothetical protein
MKDALALVCTQLVMHYADGQSCRVLSGQASFAQQVPWYSDDIRKLPEGPLCCILPAGSGGVSLEGPAAYTPAVVGGPREVHRFRDKEPSELIPVGSYPPAVGHLPPHGEGMEPRHSSPPRAAVDCTGRQLHGTQGTHPPTPRAMCSYANQVWNRRNPSWQAAATYPDRTVTASSTGVP